MMLSTLAVGLVVGLVLGATGAGGSIFAVPLFMLFLGLGINDAMGLSLAAVCAAALVGIILRNNAQNLAWKPGLTLALAGAVTAPCGRWLGDQLDDNLLTASFALLATVLALRMWQQANSNPESTYVVRSPVEIDVNMDDPASQIEQLNMAALPSSPESTPRTALLIPGGLIIGLLSGLFGVGGGFLIVPLLTLYCGMNIKKAVGTSLIVISIVSAAGFSAHLINSPMVDMKLLLTTCIGSIGGIISGTLLLKRLSGPILQKTFAASVIALMTTSLLQNYGFL
ncbi:MAG: sulfite exporter TauE/SafE family protein [Motiliproteus sp.]